MKKYNYIEPNFPEIVTLLILFVYEDGKAQNIIPFSGVYENYKDATRIVKSIVKEAKKEDKIIGEYGILLKLKFAAKIPLLKKYWANPSVSYEPWDRVHHFVNILKNPSFYQILIVPRWINEKGEQFLEATIPLKPEDAVSIERFMLSSDQVVDIKAKSAAMYSINDTLRINWKTNKVEALTPIDKNLN